jgi:hypothetical protein
MKSTVFLSIVALSSFLDGGEQPGTRVANSLIKAFTLSRRSFSLLFRLALKHGITERAIVRKISKIDCGASETVLSKDSTCVLLRLLIITL